MSEDKLNAALARHAEAAARRRAEAEAEARRVRQAAEQEAQAGSAWEAAYDALGCAVASINEKLAAHGLLIEEVSTDRNPAPAIARLIVAIRPPTSIEPIATMAVNVDRHGSIQVSIANRHRSRTKKCYFEAAAVTQDRWRVVLIDLVDASA